MTDTLKTLLAKMQAPELKQDIINKLADKHYNGSFVIDVVKESFNAAAAQRDVVIEMLKKAEDALAWYRNTMVRTPEGPSFIAEEALNEIDHTAEAALGKL